MCQAIARNAIIIPILLHRILSPFSQRTVAITRQVQWTIHLHRRPQQARRPQRMIISNGQWMHSWSGHEKNDEKSWKLVQICIIRASVKSSVPDGKRWATKRNSPTTKNSRVWAKFIWRSTRTIDIGKVERRWEKDSSHHSFPLCLDPDRNEHVWSTVRKCVGKCWSYHQLIEKWPGSIRNDILLLRTGRNTNKC